LQGRKKRRTFAVSKKTKTGSSALTGNTSSMKRAIKENALPTATIINNNKYQTKWQKV
jgi:hypothetical protein